MFKNNLIKFGDVASSGSFTLLAWKFGSLTVSSFAAFICKL